MGRHCNNKTRGTLTRKGRCTQHILPYIDLSEDSSAPVTTPGDSMGANEHHVTEVIIDQDSNVDNNEPFRLTSIEKHPSSDEDYNDEIDLKDHKRKKNNENDDDNWKKI